MIFSENEVWGRLGGMGKRDVKPIGMKAYYIFVPDKNGKFTLNCNDCDKKQLNVFYADILVLDTITYSVVKGSGEFAGILIQEEFVTNEILRGNIVEVEFIVAQFIGKEERGSVLIEKEEFYRFYRELPYGTTDNQTS